MHSEKSSFHLPPDMSEIAEQICTYNVQKKGSVISRGKILKSMYKKSFYYKHVIQVLNIGVKILSIFFYRYVCVGEIFK